LGQKKHRSPFDTRSGLRCFEFNKNYLIRLFYFFMKGIASQIGVVFAELETFRGVSFVFTSGVAAGDFALFFCFGALESDNNSIAFFCHRGKEIASEGK
jgi:hypothetical protein